MTPDIFLQGDPATQCSSLSQFLFHRLEVTEMGQNNQTTARKQKMCFFETLYFLLKAI